MRWPAAAFGLVAVGTGLTWAWPLTFANEFWSMFATGLAVGLFAGAGLSLLARAVAPDRRAVAAGVLAAVALVALSGFLAAKVSEDSIQNVTTPPINLPDNVIPSFEIPSFDIPSFPVPSFPAP
jgi:predicted PurR-regulated permease PerM